MFTFERTINDGTFVDLFAPPFPSERDMGCYIESEECLARIAFPVDHRHLVEAECLLDKVYRLCRHLDVFPRRDVDDGGLWRAVFDQVDGVRFSPLVSPAFDGFRYLVHRLLVGISGLGEGEGR